MAEIEDALAEPSDSEKRIKTLSDKVKTTAQEKEEAIRKQQEAEAAKAESDKKAAFAEGFADIIGTNPAAKDFKEDIRAKVMSGMSVEDATYAVLGKAGKLGSSTSESTTTPAGGSASTAPPSGGPKPVSQLTQEERRAQLAEMLDVT